MWPTLGSDTLPALFDALLPLAARMNDLSLQERISIVVFWQGAFQSLEEDAVVRQVVRLFGLPCWAHLPPSARDALFSQQPRLLKQWRHFERSRDSAAPAAKRLKGEKTLPPSRGEYFYEQHFIWDMLTSFRLFIKSMDTHNEPPQPLEVLYSEKIAEFLVDLLSQLPTRRYFRQLLQASFLLPVLRLCSLVTNPEAK